MIHISELSYTGYPVTDMTRARAFYEGVLNLRVATQFDHDGRYWIEYEVGASTLAVSNMSEGKWLPTPDGPAVALEVEDFDGTVAELRAAGVKFAMEPLDTGVCRMATILDPDGNSLLVHRRHPRA